MVPHIKGKGDSKRIGREDGKKKETRECVTTDGQRETEGEKEELWEEEDLESKREKGESLGNKQREKRELS